MRFVVDLEVVESSGSVTGLVRHQDHTTVAFDGWLDLLRVLEAGLETNPARSRGGDRGA